MQLHLMIHKYVVESENVTLRVNGEFDFAVNSSLTTKSIHCQTVEDVS